MEWHFQHKFQVWVLECVANSCKAAEERGANAWLARLDNLHWVAGGGVGRPFTLSLLSPPSSLLLMKPYWSAVLPTLLPISAFPDLFKETSQGRDELSGLGSRSLKCAQNSCAGSHNLLPCPLTMPCFVIPFNKTKQSAPPHWLVAGPAVSLPLLCFIFALSGAPCCSPEVVLKLFTQDPGSQIWICVCQMCHFSFNKSSS